MTESFERASTYRNRAQELRAIAEKLRDEEQRKLREVAEEYEKMPRRSWVSAFLRQARSRFGEKAF